MSPARDATSLSWIHSRAAREPPCATGRELPRPYPLPAVTAPNVPRLCRLSQRPPTGPNACPAPGIPGVGREARAEPRLDEGLIEGGAGAADQERRQEAQREGFKRVGDASCAGRETKRDSGRPFQTLPKAFKSPSNQRFRCPPTEVLEMPAFQLLFLTATWTKRPPQTKSRLFVGRAPTHWDVGRAADRRRQALGVWSQPHVPTETRTPRRRATRPSQAAAEAGRPRRQDRAPSRPLGLEPRVSGALPRPEPTGWSQLSGLRSHPPPARGSDTHCGRRKLTLTVVCPEEPAASESGAHEIWNSLWEGRGVGGAGRVSRSKRPPGGDNRPRAPRRASLPEPGDTHWLVPGLLGRHRRPGLDFLKLTQRFFMNLSQMLFQRKVPVREEPEISREQRTSSEVRLDRHQHWRVGCSRPSAGPQAQCPHTRCCFPQTPERLLLFL